MVVVRSCGMAPVHGRHGITCEAGARAVAWSRASSRRASPEVREIIVANSPFRVRAVRLPGISAAVVVRVRSVPVRAACYASYPLRGASLGHEVAGDRSPVTRPRGRPAGDPPSRIGPARTCHVRLRVGFARRAPDTRERNDPRDTSRARAVSLRTLLRAPAHSDEPFFTCWPDASTGSDELGPRRGSAFEGPGAVRILIPRGPGASSSAV